MVGTGTAELAEGVGSRVEGERVRCETVAAGPRWWGEGTDGGAGDVDGGDGRGGHGE